MKIRIKSYLFLSLLIFVFSYLLQAQDQPVQQTEPVEEPVTYSVVEIPQKIEEISVYIQNIKELIK